MRGPRSISNQPSRAGDIRRSPAANTGTRRGWLLIILGVLAAQTLAVTSVYEHTSLGIDAHGAFGLVLGILPDLFVALLTFTLAAQALDRPSSPIFGRRRLVARVLLPYVAWSFLYTWFTGSFGPSTHWSWLRTAVARVIEGNASYQFSYILLAIQLLLLMPVILRLLERFERRFGLRLLLAGSFVLQLALFTLDYRYLQTGTLASRWALFLNDAGGRLLLFYPFFVVLGALAARRPEATHRLIHRWLWWIAVALVLSLTVTVLRYVYGLLIQFESLRYATAPIQPAVLIVAAIAAVVCLGINCRSGRPPAVSRPRDHLGTLLDRAGFGILLIQGFTLNWAFDRVGVRLPLSWPAAPQIVIIWALAALGATGFSLLLLVTPGLSWLVGQPCAIPCLTAPFQRIATKAGLSRLRTWGVSLERQRRRGRIALGAVVLALIVLFSPSSMVTSAVVTSTARVVTRGKETHVRLFRVAKASTSGSDTGPGTGTSLSAAEGTITCQAPPPHDYATCLFTEKGTGETMTFYLFTPAGYNPSRKYPLVLLLHGGGQRANANKSAAANRQNILSDPYVAVWGPGYAEPDSPEVQKHWPSFIVVPQVVAPNRWVNVPANVGSYTLAPQPSDSLRLAKEIVDTLQRQYTGIDPSRLYVTGLSMGGYGAWEMIERWPAYFAAAAPLCGAGDPSKAAELKDLPIWAFHSTNDNIVPVSGSRDMIAAIRAAGGHPRYTELPNAGHEVWLDAYQILGKPTPTPGFYQWLFSQHKSTTP